MIHRRFILVALAVAYFSSLSYSYAIVESDAFRWMGFYYK